MLAIEKRHNGHLILLLFHPASYTWYTLVLGTYLTIGAPLHKLYCALGNPMYQVNPAYPPVLLIILRTTHQVGRFFDTFLKLDVCCKCEEEEIKFFCQTSGIHVLI